MATALGIGPDMGCIEHVQDMGIGKGALALVDIGNDESERALPESRHNRLRLAEPLTVIDQFRLQRRYSTRLQPQLHFRPEALPNFLFRGVPLVSLDSL